MLVETLIQTFTIGSKHTFNVSPLEYNIIQLETSRLDFLTVLGSGGFVDAATHKGGETSFPI